MRGWPVAILPLRVSVPDDTRRAALLAQAAVLPAGVATPDSLLFGEGFDPSDTYIMAVVHARTTLPVKIRYRWNQDISAWESISGGFPPHILWPAIKHHTD